MSDFLTMPTGRWLRRMVWVFFIVFSWCVHSVAIAQEPVRIGVLATYSGPYADYGRQFDAGMQVFLQQHNQQLAGRDVEFFTRDVGGANPSQARRYAQELIARHGVDVLVGLDFSPNAAAIAPLVNQAQVPTLIMNAASSGLTAASPYLFRYSFTIQQVSAPMAHWMRTQGIDNVMTIVADYASGYDAEQSFVRTFEHQGGQIVGSLRVPLDAMDFSSYLRRIAEAQPEAVFFFFPSGQMPTAFLKAWNERGMDELGIRLFATGEATDDTYLPQIGADAAGLITSHHYSVVHPSELNQGFVAAYQEMSGDGLRPSYFAVAAYDALSSLNRAIQKIDETAHGAEQEAADETEQSQAALSGPAIQKALLGMHIESPRGPIYIDEQTRDIVQTVYIREVRNNEEGEWVNVECCGAYEQVADPGDAPFEPAL